MSSQTFFLMNIILLISFLDISQSLYISEYRTLNDPILFENQTKAWTVASTLTTEIVTCNRNKLFKINRPLSTPVATDKITLQLTNVMPHLWTFLAFTFYEFSTNPTPTIGIINSLQVSSGPSAPYQYKIDSESTFTKTRACGPALGFVFETRIYGILKPTPEVMPPVSVMSSILTLGIRHNFADSTVTAFGVRDVVLSFSTTTPTISVYFIAQATSAMKPSNRLQCPTALEYKNGVVCESCDISCAGCWTGGSMFCFECAQGYSFGGMQCDACHSSCASCTGSLEDQCTGCYYGFALSSDNKCLPIPRQGPQSMLDSTSGTNAQDEERLRKTGFFDTLLTAPSEPRTVTFVTFVKFMQYVRQLQVKLPPRLDKMSASNGRPVLSLHVRPSIQDTIYSWFTSRSLAAVPVLQRQILHERFLANFGGDIFVIGIIFTCGLLFTLIKFLADKFKCPTIAMISDKFKTLTKWNLGLMLFGLYIDDIILFSVTEFKTIQFDSPSANLSFAMCVVIDIIALTFITSTILLARKAAKLKKETELTKNNKKYEAFFYNWRSFQLYFRGFNEKPFLNQLFFVLYISRTALPMLLAIALESAPVVQAVFQMLVSVVIVFYAIIFKPLRKKINQYQLVIIESIVLALNICVLSLVAMDNLGINGSPGCIFLGDTIIIGNVLINLIILIILVIKLIIMLKEIRAVYKVNRKQAAISCIHLLVPPLQQCAFGFEELLEDIATPTQANKEVVVISKVSQRSVKPIPGDFNPKVIQKTAGEQATEQPTSERLGQSSSRLLVGSQVFNQSQLFNQSQGALKFNDMSMNNESIEISPTKYPKAKKLDSYIHNIKSKGQSSIGGGNVLKKGDYLTRPYLEETRAPEGYNEANWNSRSNNEYNRRTGNDVSQSEKENQKLQL